MSIKLDTDRQWLQDVRRVDSPNSDARPDGCDIELVVMHGISLPPKQYGGPHVDQLFTNQLDPAAHPYFAEIKDLRVSSRSRSPPRTAGVRLVCRLLHGAGNLQRGHDVRTGIWGSCSREISALGE